MNAAVGAQCRTDTLGFELPDPDRTLTGVRLIQHAGLSKDRLDFSYDEVGRVWRLTVARPPLWRLEYLLERRGHDGGTDVVCDPENPRRVGGAFGDKSVLECPEYATPAWLQLPPAEGSWREVTLPAPAIRSQVSARIWSPGEPTDRVLVAHDGPEYERLAALAHYSAAMVGAGSLPPHHLVLLAPGERNEWYSAAFGALFLQSGSFFQPRYDRMESGFRRYLRIVRFTGRVLRAVDGPPVPAVLTCGLVEENLHNNRDMAATLLRQGYQARLFEVPDAHNYTGWRDAFDPYLTDLLRHVWR